MLADEPRIGTIADRAVATCRPSERLGDILPHEDLCVVVNEAGVVLGDVRGKALKGDPTARVEDVMNPAPSTYRPNVSVHEMAHAFFESNARRVLVADCDGRLIGSLTREAVEAALNGEHEHADGPVLASSN